MRRTWILHPFLVALFPVASLLARNIGQVPAGAGVRAALACLTLAAVLWVVVWTGLRHWPAAAVFTSLALLLFFSYGHVYNQIEGLQLAGLTLGRHRFLAALWLALLLGGAFWIRGRKTALIHWTGPLNLLAAVLLLFPLTSLLIAGLSTPAQGPAPQASGVEPPTVPAGSLPDIYLIVVDGYARQDMLEMVHGYDNGSFIRELESRGFEVVDGSRSNYPNTALSLATALNLDYLPAILPNLDPESRDLAPLQEAIVHSAARRMAEDLGYQIVAFASGYRPTEMTDADQYLQPPLPGAAARGIAGELTPFEGMLLETTGARLLLEFNALLPAQLRLGLDAPYQAHRARILHALDGLGEVAKQAEPTFTFAHQVIPHPPFVFDAEGQPLAQTSAYTLGDTPYDGSRQEYSQRYTDQVVFLNQRLLTVIDEILATSATPPVIVVVSDHGSGATALPGPPPPVDYVNERFANFTALYLPDCEVDSLPTHLTPVNTLRLVFAGCFGQDFPLLEDRSYLSSYVHPFDLRDVTDQLRD